MPSCAENPVNGTEELARLYAEWHACADDLCALAERQRDLLRSSEDGSLQAVLDEKEALYLRTQALSERAELLTEARSRPPFGDSPSGDGQAEIDSARARLFERLMRLSDLEAESRRLLRERMDRLGEEMEGFGRRRSLASAYGTPAGPAESPRFLDQKR
jgi:hypothetical protein